MTEGDVRRRAELVDEIADLPERAHVEEDRLYCDVLQAIAAGAADAPSLARAALTVRSIDFRRSYSAAGDDHHLRPNVGRLPPAPPRPGFAKREFAAGFFAAGALVLLFNFI
ncbi:hypothetical protein G7077_02410 [Sphingomonas piscis]|uniref:Uncharacterized protein n=1 Tax=Sphingomonas piscis TaxID=2714943 RepID=A0A6G7YMJ2_9SPHN|nr:hypothetical protein [Sphingomonas piscis]QIK77936.1 hypothetical protein G7077_02410 [Sphingomonas piscis]